MILTPNWIKIFHKLLFTDYFGNMNTTTIWLQKIVLTPIKKTTGFNGQNQISQEINKGSFSDEKNIFKRTWYLFKYWRNSKTPNQTINMNKLNGGGITVHVCVSFNGAILLVEMLEKYDLKKFCSLMEDKVLLLIPLYLEDSQYVFKQNNFPVHKSSYSIA